MSVAEVPIGMVDSDEVQEGVADRIGQVGVQTDLPTVDRKPPVYVGRGRIVAHQITNQITRCDLGADIDDDVRQLQIADLLYDLDTLHVSRAGQPLKLNPLGLKLLAILMQRSPAVVRREALEEALWGDDCPDSDSLRSHVHQLRQVLDKPFPSPLLHTIHGVGYRLAENEHAG